jgi:hypothetical protein
MEPDPFLTALETIIPIAVFTVFGLVCIYSVIGVPLGIIFLGVAIGMGVAAVRRHHREVPHH